MLIEKLLVWIYRLRDVIRGNLGAEVMLESRERREEILRSMNLPREFILLLSYY
jgi:hypothetical protein